MKRDRAGDQRHAPPLRRGRRRILIAHAAETTLALRCATVGDWRRRALHDAARSLPFIGVTVCLPYALFCAQAFPTPAAAAASRRRKNSSARLRSANTPVACCDVPQRWGSCGSQGGAELLRRHVTPRAPARFQEHRCVRLCFQWLDCWGLASFASTGSQAPWRSKRPGVSAPSGVRACV